MSTRGGIINGALNLLSQERVNNAESGNPAAEHAEAEYDQIINSVFEGWDWFWASRVMALEETDGSSVFQDGYAVYRSPPLARRIIRVFRPSRGEMDSIPYRQDRDGIHAPKYSENEPLRVRVVERVKEPQFPSWFALACEGALAVKISPRWAAERSGDIIVVAGDLMKKAKLADSKNYAGMMTAEGIRDHERFFGNSEGFYPFYGSGFRFGDGGGY